MILNHTKLVKKTATFGFYSPLTICVACSVQKYHKPDKQYLTALHRRASWAGVGGLGNAMLAVLSEELPQ